MSGLYLFDGCHGQNMVALALSELLRDGPAVLSIDEVARVAGVGYSTVQRAFRALDASRLLRRTARRDPGDSSGFIRGPSLLEFDHKGFAALKRAGVQAVRARLDQAYARVAVLRARRLALLENLKVSRTVTMTANNETSSSFSSLVGDLGLAVAGSVADNLAALREMTRLRDLRRAGLA